MKWEAKVEMLQHLNGQQCNVHKRNNMRLYIKGILSGLDMQGLDMLLHGLTLIPEYIREDIEFYKKVQKKGRDMFADSTGGVVRIVYKLTYLDALIEAENHLN